MNARIHPLTQQPINGKPRKELAKALKSWREQRAKYDAASQSDEFKNYWAAADSYDADSANSYEVRQRLIARSRYEVANNGYADGIASTYSTDLIGTGPQLRMQTNSVGFNSLVEREWFLWTKAIGFRRKLWCMAHAKHTDGEGFGVLRRNAKIKHALKLDWVLYEAEQCQSQFQLPMAGKIDGIEFDEFGNPTFYEFLRYHPGGLNSYGNYLGVPPDRVPAAFVTHWYRMRRPGQHRGVPEITSTLNTGAAARRFREATLAAAETAADFAVLLKTQFEPDSEEMQYASDFSTQEITKRMMTALPVGYEPSQMKAEHPNASYAEFTKSLINEQARPKSMPYNKAACDSSSYNYASGRLDHQTYYGHLDVDRADCNDLVLDTMFDAWFDAAILRFGWLGGNPEAVGPGARFHEWDWPKHRVADIQSEAGANKTKLATGEESLHSIYTATGRDYADEVEKSAASNGITPQQQQQINLLLNLPQHVIPFVAQMLGMAPATQPAATPVADTEETPDGEE